MKKLYLIRHAKSSWKHPELDDSERPLNGRGKRDAPRIGKFLKQKGVKPDLMMSSPANRAHTTAKKIAEELGYPLKDILVNSKLYVFSSYSGTVLDILSQVDNRHDTVMIFGHNPTFTALANDLSGTYFDNVPTCGVVCIDFDTDNWKEIDKTKSSLDFFMFPKLLADN